MQIAISTMSLNNEDVKTANGRDIYRELCVKKDYSNWVKAQIERADLVENTDYVKVAQKGELSATGQTSIEYHFTVESGKHIAMMSATAKGKAVRNYFLECEKQAKQQPKAPPPTPMQSAISDMQAWKDAAAIFRVPESLALVEGVKHVAISYSIDFQPLLLASPAMNDIQDKDVMLEPTEIGGVLGLSARQANAMLCAAGLQVKTGGQWVPTESAKGYYSKHMWLSPTSGKSGYNLKWNLDFVRKTLGK